jgi:hypothetical protein
VIFLAVFPIPPGSCASATADGLRKAHTPAGIDGNRLAEESGVATPNETRNLGRLKFLVLLNVGLQLLDGAVTYIGTNRGYVEGNPIVAAAMTSIGPMGGLLSMKGAAILLLLIIYRRGHLPLVQPSLMSLAVAYTFLAILPWTLMLAGLPTG